MPDSLRPHGLQPTRLLCSWDSPGKDTGVNFLLEKPFPSPGGLPDPGIEPRSPALQADSLPTELQGKLNWINFCISSFEQNFAFWKTKEDECSKKLIDFGTTFSSQGELNNKLLLFGKNIKQHNSLNVFFFLTYLKEFQIWQMTFLPVKGMWC